MDTEQIGLTGVDFKGRTSRTAIAAFVMGLLCLTCVGWPLLFLPAIICGVIALILIANNKGQLKGVGLAVTGIVVGNSSSAKVAWMVARARCRPVRPLAAARRASRLGRMVAAELATTGIERPPAFEDLVADTLQIARTWAARFRPLAAQSWEYLMPAHQKTPVASPQAGRQEQGIISSLARFYAHFPFHASGASPRPAAVLMHAGANRANCERF